MFYEGKFKAQDGVELYECRWEAEAARANLVLIHGYGEYCGRYEHVAQGFARAGITVHSLDQRGYGRSPGKRAYIDRFDGLLEDFDAYMANVRPRLNGLPLFLMGHSMGGLVLTRYAETRPLDAQGLVFSSPFLAFSDDVPKFLIALADILGTLAPWLPVGGVDNTGLSRDPAVVAAADADPLAFHGKVRARTGAQFNAAIKQAHAEFSKITLPAMIIHGGSDKVVSNAGSRALHAGCGSADKTFKIYEGGYHELWNDLEKDAVLAAIRDWILARS